MQSIEIKTPSNFSNQNISFYHRLGKRNQGRREISFSARLCDCAKREKITSSFLLFSHQNKFKIQLFKEKNKKLQAVSLLPQIKDPLWVRICDDVASMIGSSFIPKIRACKLGIFHPSTKSIDLYYQTKEVGSFLKQFDYVIVEALHKYFPSLKDLKIHEISSKR